MAMAIFTKQQLPEVQYHSLLSLVGGVACKGYKVVRITPEIEQWSQRVLKRVDSSPYTAGIDCWSN